MSFFSASNPGGADIEHQADVSTGDANPVVLWEKTLQDGRVYFFEAKVVGRRTDSPDRSGRVLKVCAFREGGGATLQDFVSEDFNSESDVDWDCNFEVSGNNIQLKVKGDAAQLVNWSAVILENHVS